MADFSSLSLKFQQNGWITSTPGQTCPCHTSIPDTQTCCLLLARTCSLHMSFLGDVLKWPAKAPWKAKVGKTAFLGSVLSFYLNSQKVFA